VPELYAARGVNMEQMVADILTKNGLRGPSADAKTPVILQTFNPDTVKKLASMKIGVPVVLLIFGQGIDSWGNRESVAVAKSTGAAGLGPPKELLLKYPQVVGWAHELGLTVTPYTFRARNPGTFKSVKEEMAHFLYDLDVDAVFTDNPDQFPRAR
jgi:glycerophosphoryl diester phosphodiesterase